MLSCSCPGPRTEAVGKGAGPWHGSTKPRREGEGVFAWCRSCSCCFTRSNCSCMACSLICFSDSILSASHRAHSPSSYFWIDCCKAEWLGRLRTGTLTALTQGCFGHPHYSPPRTALGLMTLGRMGNPTFTAGPRTAVNCTQMPGSSGNSRLPGQNLGNQVPRTSGVPRRVHTPRCPFESSGIHGFP